MTLSEQLDAYLAKANESVEKFRLIIEDPDVTDDKVLEEFLLLPISVVDRWLENSPSSKLWEMLQVHRLDVATILAKAALGP